MKMNPCLVRLALPVLAILGLSSCAAPTYVDGPAPGVNTSYSAYGTGFVTYSTLPAGYTGSAYYHQGRYYAGGRQETGRYTYQGRTYTSRYAHNGRYYYGGTHQNHAGQRVSSRPYYGSARRFSNVNIGSNVNTGPTVSSSTNVNADIHTTASSRGPVISFGSPPSSSTGVNQPYDFTPRR